MGIKDTVAAVGLGAIAAQGFATATPANTPNMDQVDDAIGISRDRNAPSETDMLQSNQPTTSGKP